MECKLTFLGAAQNVTGSQYVIETPEARVMIDCGFYQERRLSDRNWAPFAHDPGSIDAVLLTHAHLDHCGLLPRLVAQGYKGDILCTSPTADIAKIVMEDSARIQEEDIRYKWKRHKREGRTSPHPYDPLYTVEHAQQASSQLKDIPFGKELHIAGDIFATFHEAGHILGAASIVLKVKQGEEERTILFSGDIGRTDMPILKDPTTFKKADYVIMESTYGDRDHEQDVEIDSQLEEIIKGTIKRGGNIVIPAFAVERSQDLLYHLSRLRREKRIPYIMVFLDSPMAVKVTEVFRRHREFFDEETKALLEQQQHPCDFQGLELSRTVQQSKAINMIRGSVIIIAGSGMCTGGRIKHHLKANIERSASTVLFVGYQSEGTLGRAILQKPQSVRIHGEDRAVKAEIERINGFSGHAGRQELLAWISSLEEPPREIFLTHGDPAASQSLKDLIVNELGFPVSLPEYRQVVNIT